MVKTMLNFQNRIIMLIMERRLTIINRLSQCSKSPGGCDSPEFRDKLRKDALWILLRGIFALVVVIILYYTSVLNNIGGVFTVLMFIILFDYMFLNKK